MTALSISAPFPTFSDADGDPLDSGYIYIGAANQNPVTNPITVYWDAALTIPAAQPIRTSGGYPQYNGTAANLYVNSDYSIRVTNKNGTLVYSAAAATARFSDVVVSGIDSSEVSYLPAGTGAVATTVQTKLRESVSVLDYGADSTGATDSTAAVQAATNTGKPVKFPAGSYKVSGVTYAGKVVWLGEGDTTILSDGSILSATSAGDSIIDNITLNNITAPWIITRNPSNWAASVAGTLQQSNSVLGYMPTVNDTDIWSSLTAAQQNQTISPTITLDGASNITVSRIKGRFAVVIIKNAVDSVIRDCNIRGGKSQFGALVFDNSATQNGVGNRAINNKVRYSSNNGVCFLGNSDFEAIGNNCSRNGESGVKTYQNAGYYNYRGLIEGNSCNENYYDGIDAASSYPLSTSILTYHNIVGNRCYRNGGTGLNTDGQGNNVEANHLYFNYKNGIWAVCTNSLIGANKLVDNNQLRNASTHELLVDVAGVTNNSIVGNKIWSGAGANSNAIYVQSGSTHYIANNFAKGSTFFFGNAGSINSVCENNVDDTTGVMTTQKFSIVLFNNGGTLQHLTKGEGITGGYGSKASRIVNSTAALTTTPTGADSTTAFAAGAKIGSASTNILFMDTAAQYLSSFEGIATVEYNDTGTPVIVTAGNSSININGVTRNRLAFQFFVASTGADFALTTANIPSGKAITISFYGKVA